MNTDTTRLTEGSDSVLTTNLYQEPSAGLHYFVRRDNVPCSYRSHNPFYSTGNFDQAINAPKNAPNPKTFFSCGNFLTSTKQEDWNIEDFHLNRFNTDTLKHSPQNLKFCVGKNDINKYDLAPPTRYVPRTKSEDALENVESEHNDSPQMPMTISMAKPQSPKRNGSNKAMIQGSGNEGSSIHSNSPSPGKERKSKFGPSGNLISPQAAVQPQNPANIGQKLQFQGQAIAQPAIQQYHSPNRQGTNVNKSTGQLYSPQNIQHYSQGYYHPNPHMPQGYYHGHPSHQMPYHMQAHSYSPNHYDNHFGMAGNQQGQGMQPYPKYRSYSGQPQGGPNAGFTGGHEYGQGYMGHQPSVDQYQNSQNMVNMSKTHPTSQGSFSSGQPKSRSSLQHTSSPSRAKPNQFKTLNQDYSAPEEDQMIEDIPLEDVSEEDEEEDNNYHKNKSKAEAQNSPGKNLKNPSSGPPKFGSSKDIQVVTAQDDYHSFVKGIEGAPNSQHPMKKQKDSNAEQFSKSLKQSNPSSPLRGETTKQKTTTNEQAYNHPSQNELIKNKKKQQEVDPFNGLDENSFENPFHDSDPNCTDPLARLFHDIKSQCLSHLLSKKNCKRQDLSVLNDNLEEDYSDYRCEDLLDMSLSSKESSIKVQSFLKGQDAHALDYTASFLCQHLETLVLDKFGNYVIQYLIQIHAPSRELTSQMTLSNFVMYAENEYGSRIMQKLCSLNPEYCTKALKLFYKNFDRLIKYITGSILLSKLISSSQNEEEYLFTIRILDTNKEYLRKAYFNRMLSTLVSCCSEKTLLDVLNCIRIHIWILMNDKFGNYVLQILMERAPPNKTSLIKLACLKNYPVVLTRKYPKFLLIRIVELENEGEFSTQMTSKVLELDNDSLYAILAKRDSAMLLLLILSHQVSKAIPQSIQRIQNLLDEYRGSELPHCKLRSNLRWRTRAKS